MSVEDTERSLTKLQREALNEFKQLLNSFQLACMNAGSRGPHGSLLDMAETRNRILLNYMEKIK